MIMTVTKYSLTYTLCQFCQFNFKVTHYLCGRQPQMSQKFLHTLSGQLNHFLKFFGGVRLMVQLELKTLIFYYLGSEIEMVRLYVNVQFQVKP